MTRAILVGLTCLLSCTPLSGPENDAGTSGGGGATGGGASAGGGDAAGGGAAAGGGEAAGGGAGTGGGAALPPKRLSVSGASILDPDGKPIILRGYNWGEWGTAQPQDPLENLGQGANSVRIPLRWWGDWKPGVDADSADAGDHLDPAHLLELDRTMDLAIQHHLWVVLFIDSNYGQGAHDAGDNFWTDAARKQQFIEVWQSIVTRYRDREYIGAWEILPEPRPNGVSDSQVRAFYDSIIPSLRALDARTPIVVGPNDAYSLNHLDNAYSTVDPNLIYTGDYFIFTDPLNRIADIRAFEQKYNAPVWINQVGLPSSDADAGLKAEAVLGALNDAGVGWAWWTYRVLALTPDTHGIYYVNGADGGWIEKTSWFDLVGTYMKP